MTKVLKLCCKISVCYEFPYEISQLYDNILHLKFCYWWKTVNFIK